jgi:hypothetical protein
MDMKINQLNYYDFNINLNLTYNLYLKELNKTLVTIYTITLSYDIDKKSHFFDIKVNYELENIEENLIKIELKEVEKKYVPPPPPPQPKININELLDDLDNLKNKIKHYEENNEVFDDVKEKVIEENNEVFDDVKEKVIEDVKKKVIDDVKVIDDEKVIEVNKKKVIEVNKEKVKETVKDYDSEDDNISSHSTYLCPNVDVIEKPNKKKIQIESKLIDLLNDSNIVPSQLELVNNDNEDIEEKIYCHLKLISSGSNIKNNITFIITQLIKFVETFKIPGVQKKTFIISAINKCLLEDNYDKDSINFIINDLCPDMIDMLISVDKRKVSIKKKSLLPCK